MTRLAVRLEVGFHPACELLPSHAAAEMVFDFGGQIALSAIHLGHLVVETPEPRGQPPPRFVFICNGNINRGGREGTLVCHVQRQRVPLVNGATGGADGLRDQRADANTTTPLAGIAQMGRLPGSPSSMAISARHAREPHRSPDPVLRAHSHRGPGSWPAAPTWEWLASGTPVQPSPGVARQPSTG